MRFPHRPRIAVAMAASLAMAAALAAVVARPPASPAQVVRRPPAATAVATIQFLDVGQGDAILIRSPEGRAALIDAGPSKAVVSTLRDLGVTAIDLVLVTHHHSDHYGGMPEVIRTFRPRYFVATTSPHTTSQYLRLLELVRDRGMTMVVPTGRRRNIELGSVVLTMLPQPPENPQEENDNSIGIRVTHGDLSILLTGDSEDGSRRWWLANCPELVENCDILKLAHHGSRNGTDARWLDVVRPELAVVSLASGNSYGHPHPETLALLEQKRIPLLRTDEAGTITIRSDGRRWQVDRPGALAARAPPLLSKPATTRASRPRGVEPTESAREAAKPPTLRWRRSAGRDVAPDPDIRRAAAEDDGGHPTESDPDAATAEPPPDRKPADRGAPAARVEIPVNGR